MNIHDRITLSIWQWRKNIGQLTKALTVETYDSFQNHPNTIRDYNSIVLLQTLLDHNSTMQSLKSDLSLIVRFV